MEKDLLKINNIKEKKEVLINDDDNDSNDIFCGGYENWLNETLKTGENLGIKGILIKPTHKKPLARYGIDKMQLVGSKMNIEDINRIYSSLFVYSVGFYDMISDTLKHSSDKDNIQSQIWRVFQVLLEYCLEGRHNKIIHQVHKEN